VAEAVPQEAEPESGDAEATGEGAEEGVVPKKRTRRGTRGGRNRKRKPASANGDGATAPADEAVDAPSPAEPADAEPVEAGASAYVPMSEWIEDFDRRS